MNSIKKGIVSIILVCVFALSSVATFAADGATITVGSATAKAGETVEISIDLSGNPGFIGMTASLDFDSATLSIPRKIDNLLVEAATFTNDIRRVLVWEADKNMTANGTIAIVAFTIDPAAKPGEYTVGFNVESATDDDLNDIVFSTVPGTITVKANETTQPSTTEPETTTKAPETTTEPESKTEPPKTTEPETTTEPATEPTTPPSTEPPVTTTTTKPSDSGTTTTTKNDESKSETTTAKKTGGANTSGRSNGGKIAQTGESRVGIAVASVVGVIALAGTAVAFRKKHEN